MEPADSPRRAGYFLCCIHTASLKLHSTNLNLRQSNVIAATCAAKAQVCSLMTDLTSVEGKPCAFEAAESAAHAVLPRSAVEMSAEVLP